MKILALTAFYPPDTAGDADLGCRQAVDALRDRGHDVRVLTTAPRTPAPVVPHVVRSLKLSDVGAGNRYVLGRSIDVSNRLLQAEATGVVAYNVHALTGQIEDFQPDVVFVGTIIGVGGLGLMATLRHLEVPWVWSLADDAPVQLCRSRGEVVEPLRREVNRQLDGRFLATSEQVIAEVEAAGIAIRAHAEVVPPWVVGPAPAPRVAFHRPGETLRVVAVGPVGMESGTDLLIEAVAVVRDRGFANITLDLHGDLDDPACPTLARRLGVHDLVRFWRARSEADLARIWAHADLLAVPTDRREPFALLPLAASWAGCVPLVTAIGGQADWGVHGVHCLKADRTVAAFAGSFEAVLNGSIALEPIARRAAAVVGRDFHLDAQLPKIERALVEAANRPRKRLRADAGAEAYRMALLAEKLTVVLVQEAAAQA